MFFIDQVCSSDFALADYLGAGLTRAIESLHQREVISCNPAILCQADVELSERIMQQGLRVGTIRFGKPSIHLPPRFGS